MYLITDIKDTDLCTAISDLVALAEEDPAILDRFIIQLYTGREKTPFRKSILLKIPNSFLRPTTGEIGN